VTPCCDSVNNGGEASNNGVGWLAPMKETQTQSRMAAATLLLLLPLLQVLLVKGSQ